MIGGFLRWLWSGGRTLPPPVFDGRFALAARSRSLDLIATIEAPVNGLKDGTRRYELTAAGRTGAVAAQRGIGIQAPRRRYAL